MKFKILSVNKNNTKIFLILILIFISFIYYYFGFHQIENYVVEVFTNFKNVSNDNKWSEDLKKRFLTYQNTMSKNNYRYDLQVLQQQVSPKEVEEYLKTGYWNWDETLKEIYLDKVNSSTLVNTNPEVSLNYAMKMYTPKAIEQLLAWNYKEGEFLLYGAEDINGNIVKCSTDDEPFLTSDGKNKINNEDIPNVVRGFSFINESCNPCIAINDTNSSSCKFKLNVKGDDNSSEIWKKIWNL
jgi:hypothetical protein